MIVIHDTQIVAALPAHDTRPTLGVNATTGYAYVPVGDGVMVVDGTQALATLDLDHTPREIESDPVRGYVYVRNLGELPDWIGSVSVLSGTQHLGTLPVGSLPADLAVNPHTGYVYAANSWTQDVFVLRGTEMIGRVELDYEPYALVASPVSDYVYVSYTGESPVYMLGVLSGLQVVSDIPVESSVLLLAHDPVGDCLYTRLGEEKAITVYRRLERITTLPVEGVPRLVALHPVTGAAYVFGDSTTTVSLLRLVDGRLRSYLPLTYR